MTVGWTGDIFRYRNGDGWSQMVSGTTTSMNGIAYGNSTFIAVGDTGLILRSAANTIFKEDFEGEYTP